MFNKIYYNNECKFDMYHEFRHISDLADSAVSWLRCLRMINPAFENNRSAGTDVAGVPRKSRAIVAKHGYSCE